LKDKYQQKQLKQVSVELSNEFPLLAYDVDGIACRQVMSDILSKQPSGEKKIYSTLSSEWMQPYSGRQHIAIVGQSQIGNILQFLTCNSCSLPWIDPNSLVEKTRFKNVVHRLNTSENQKDAVCIIFDDLEKSNFMYKKYNTVRNIHKLTNAGYFVTNIWRNWFRKSQKIVLLNFLQYFEFKRNCNISMNEIHVLGINTRGQKEMVEKNTSGCAQSNAQQRTTNEELVCRNFDMDFCSNHTCCYCCTVRLLNRHNDVRSLCFVPYNCKLLLQKHTEIQNLLKNPSDLQSKNCSVEMASLLMFNELKKLFKSNKFCRFNKISDFAWKNYKKSTFVFEEEDLKDLNETESHIFFSSKQKSSSFNEPIFFFSHVFLQEILAAWRLLSLENTEVLKKELSDHKNTFHGGNFMVVFKFMSHMYNCEPSRKWKMKKENVFDLIKLVYGE